MNETTMLVVKLFGPLLLLVGLGILFHKDYFLGVFKAFYKDAALMYVTAMMSFILGLLILVIGDHNIWVADWPVIITIIGWISLLKGITFMLMPALFKKMAAPWLKKSAMNAAMLLTLILGLALTYAGYF